ncbi:MAG: FAD-dependent oxidoreductase [Patescibacteria group bacterium]
MTTNKIYSQHQKIGMGMYDVVIIGSGPAGLAAGIYSARYKLNSLIIGKEFGGACATSHQIENYLGFISISGADLAKKFIEHVKNYNIEIINNEVKGIVREAGIFIIHTPSQRYQAKTIILASGTQRKKLNIPGEAEFLGRGVSYCATCDCRFFKNKVAAVIGGSDAAVTSALLLAEYAKKVHIILRRDVFRAEPIWVEKLNQNSKIEKILNTQVVKILGDKIVKSLELSREFNGKKNLAVDGIFIEIGTVPASIIANNLGVTTTKEELIEVDKDCVTNITGCFAAGDITTASNLKQIITAAAQGAIAATSAYKYIQKLKK